MDDFTTQYEMPKLPRLFLFLVMLGLVTSALLLLIDMKIKNDLVMTAQQWEERINGEARRFVQEELGDIGNDNHNGAVRGDVYIHEPSGMEAPNVSELPTEKPNESGSSRPTTKPRSRARNTGIQPKD